MKRILFIFLACALLLCSCAEEEKSFADITDTSALLEYYSGYSGETADWRIVAALYLEGEDVSAYSISLNSDGSLGSYASCAISGAILTTFYEFETAAVEYCQPLLEAVNAPSDIPTYDLCLSLMALYVCDIQPDDLTPAMTYLADIQLSDGGWGVDSEDAVSDPYVSAMVLNVITAYRSDYGNNDSRDALLTYLGNCIENDNTISDTDGKSSSVATMGVLNALIYAGIPANGEISTALCTAMGDFSAGGTYSEYKEPLKHSENATAEMFLAFATARRASIFSFFSEEYKDIINQ